MTAGNSQTSDAAESPTGSASPVGAPSRAERVESALQVALMLAVGAVAAAASWSHVLALSEAHGQRGWLAYAVAACVESGAVSAGLEVRRRRRVGQPVTVPAVVLVAATVLQLSAQVAEAQRSPWGVTLAAVPAVTFLVLCKLALGRSGHGAEIRPCGTDFAPDASPEVVTAVTTSAAVAAAESNSLVNSARAASHNGSVCDSPEAECDTPALPAEVVAHGRRVAEDLATAGHALTHRRLVAGFRGQGRPLSSARASLLLRELRAMA